MNKDMSLFSSSDILGANSRGNFNKMNLLKLLIARNQIQKQK